MTECIVISHEKTIAHHYFGIQTIKGREIGAMIKCWTRQYIKPEDATAEEKAAAQQSIWGGPSLITHEPGLYYVFEPQATRNGLSYGACQKSRESSTPALREANIKKYLTAAARRAGLKNPPR